MGAFGLLVKESWPLAVNSSGTVEMAWCRKEGCPGLHPSPALPNHAITEPSSGTHPMMVLTAASDAMLALTALKGRQRFHHGQESTQCIKNTKRGSKLFFDLTIVDGMWEGDSRDSRWSAQQVVCLFRGSSLFISFLNLILFCFVFNSALFMLV